MAGRLTKIRSRADRRLAAISVEYMAILALVVIPIALCVPMILRLIALYAGRVIWVIRSPWG
jgi:hypothetical protein